MDDSTRRTFLKTAAVTTAASQMRILGANDRMRLGAIGVGGRGQYLVKLASQAPGTEIAAVCDVYEPRRAETQKQFAPAGRAVVDYREILDDKSIDAVIVATPDHW